MVPLPARTLIPQILRPECRHLSSFLIYRIVFRFLKFSKLLIQCDKIQIPFLENLRILRNIRILASEQFKWKRRLERLLKITNYTQKFFLKVSIC